MGNGDKGRGLIDLFRVGDKTLKTNVITFTYIHNIIKKNH